MSNEPHSPSSETEPTVLDLFKSVTKSWSSFGRFVVSLFDSAEREDLGRSVTMEQVRVQQEPEPVSPSTSWRHTFPWRSAGAVLLALLAQKILDTPVPNVQLALALYFFAVGLVIWAFVDNEWRLPPLQESTPAADSMTVRFIPLVAAAVLTPVAYWLFDGNLFTVLNLAVWGLALFFFFWAFRENRRGLFAGLRSLVGFLRRETWELNLARGTVLFAALWVAVFGLTAFFRLNHIDTVPVEPFSDHAEKILDVYDVSQGQTHIFFERNTGREAIQMYWTLLISWIFGTGLSYLSLKLGTALLGVLTLPYVYLLGKEVGGRRVGLLAMFLFGVAYWPNVIARIGLRFPLYPLFVAPTFYYLLRGLRTGSRNDFLLCGLFVGLGLHGYSPFRMVPLIVVAAVVLYILFEKSAQARKQAVWWLILVGVTSFLVFLPLFNFMVHRPDLFSYRAMSRLGNVETPLPGPPLQIFLSNFWNALKMFNLDDGAIWVNSIPHRPALDIVTGALFVIGVVLMAGRLIRRRDWRDLFILVSIPLLLMPSILSLAYPGENPALNRAGGASVMVFLVVALAVDGLLTTLSGSGGAEGRTRVWLGWGLTGLLLVVTAYQNYDLVLHQFADQYRAGSWNTSEMGKVISDFRDKYGETDTVWIVPYPYWVDTRLPGVWAGIPNRDFAVFPENLSSTVDAPFPKLFIYDQLDTKTPGLLKELYPNGTLSRYASADGSNKDFMLYFVER